MILLSIFFFLFNFLRHSGLEAHIEMCRTRLKYERKEINQKMNSEVLSSFRQHAAAVIPPFSSSSYLLFAPRPSSSLSLQGDISSRHNSAGEGCVLDSSSSYSIKDCLDFQISLGDKLCPLSLPRLWLLSYSSSLWVITRRLSLPSSIL